MSRLLYTLYLAVALVAAVIPSTATATVHTVQVGLGGNQFVPNAVNVCVNDTVRFVWASGFHTVTSANVPGGAATFNQQLNSGGVTVFEYVPTVAGSYQYLCNFHGGMAGSFTAAAAPAAPVPTNSGPVCAGTPLDLMASPVPNATYYWAGPNGFASITQNPSLVNPTPAMSGTYLVVAIANGCTSNVAGTVVDINPIPPAPAVGSNSPVCEGTDLNMTASPVPNATYDWTGPNGFTNSSQNPTLAGATPAMAGTYNVVTIENGCTSNVASTNVTIAPAPPAPTAGNNGPVCVGQSVDLTASTVAGATYQWSGPGAFTTTNQNHTLNNTTTGMAGIYSVVAIAGNCTSLVATTDLTLNALPTPVVQQAGQSITTTPFANYQWNDANGAISGANSQTYVPTANGMYTVTVIDGNSCEGISDPFQVDFIAGAQDRTPALAFSTYPNPASGSITVSAAGNSRCSYTLTDATGRTLRTGTSAQAQFAVLLEGIPAGVYLLRVTNAAGLGGVQRVVVQ